MQSNCHLCLSCIRRIDGISDCRARTHWNYFDSNPSVHRLALPSLLEPEVFGDDARRVTKFDFQARLSLLIQGQAGNWIVALVTLLHVDILDTSEALLAN